jgi:hypothetical protein
MTRTSEDGSFTKSSMGDHSDNQKREAIQAVNKRGSHRGLNFNLTQQFATTQHDATTHCDSEEFPRFAKFGATSALKSFR